MWKVEALDEDGIGVYVYKVTAPRTADPESVVCCAYSLHGHYYREGLVQRLLGPEHHVEYIG